MSTSYETNFAVWLDEQVKLLRNRKFDDLDMGHLIEEIEDLGNQRDTIERLWALTLQHMLKWKYQSCKRCNSWRKSIKTHSKNASKKFKNNPCNKRHVIEMFQDAYEEACAEAYTETGIDKFPEKCEWTYHQLMDEDFINKFVEEVWGE